MLFCTFTPPIERITPTPKVANARNITTLPSSGTGSFHRLVKVTPHKQTPAGLAALAEKSSLQDKLAGLKSQYAQYQIAKRAAETKAFASGNPSGGGGAASQAGFVELTAGQIVFNGIATSIVLNEPTPFGEAILGAINLGFLIYNNPPTLQMSIGKPKMQGGGQNQRDRGFKGYPEEFKKWDGHGQKGNGKPDFTTKDVQELYKQWILNGRPKLFK